MRQLLIWLILFITGLVWFAAPLTGLVRATASQPTPIIVRAASAPALFWLALTLAATAIIAFAFGWQAARLRERRAVGVALSALLALAVGMALWLIGPEVLRRANTPLHVLIRAANAGALLWFSAALLCSTLALIALGASAQGVRAARLQHRALFTVVDHHAPYAIVLCDRRGRVRWMNAAAKPLIDGRVARLRSDAAGLVGRTVTTRRVAGQTLALNEGARLNVQTVLLPHGLVGVIAQPAQGDGVRSSFYEQFIRRIVHDMRNPLAAIIAHASNLTAAPAPDLEAWRTSAHTIENEAQRLTRLVDSILFDARLSYVPPNLEQIDLTDVLEEVYYQHDERASAEGKIIALDMPPTPVPLLADRDLLVRAFGNLLDNSLKYSRAASVVRVTLDESPEHYTVRVIDSGDGIPPQYLPEQIFEPLVRTRPRDGRSGSGLGLSIVKKIVEMHGGSITAESVVGEGTTMSVCLPKR